MKICFMGSMDFAVEILEKLNMQFGVDLVVTQPDKPYGRKQQLKGTPVKEKAIELGIETFQPINIKKDYLRIIDSDFDFIIVAAYGQIIPDVVLEHAKYRAINVHASLLPKYRGGSPMHKAIINGERTTGVSIMYMVKKMDAGPILTQEEIGITLTDDVKSLEYKLAEVGAKLLVKTMKELINNSSEAIPQDESRVTYAYNITPKEKKLDFNQRAYDCYNLVRGLHPWPISEMYVDGLKIKVFKSLYSNENVSEVPGEIVNITKKGVYIQTKDGLFILKEVQLQGKKKMDINAFMNGVGRNILTLNKTI
ncbi:MAG: methionyl-tRNA formyltransferase [Tenericutes bacterium]|jgi:methionyl-tRNA formyltransferase|nr:methionyl-tRNA formyltransferase [Mycoplasmatota bacterium]